jgi:hypothetical protein
VRPARPPRPHRQAGRRARQVAGFLTGVLLLLLVVIRWSRAESVEEPLPPGKAEAPMPTSKGLPNVVRAAVQFVDVRGVDENAQTFDATIDLRLRWEDTSLRGHELIEVSGDAADEALAGIWVPKVELANLEGDPAYRERGVVISRDGSVELIERVRGTFHTPFRVKRFPFDRHMLEVHAVVRGKTLDQVVLDFVQDDVAFSRARDGIEIDGWSPTVVDLARSPVPGFRGQFHAGVVAGLWVERDWTGVLAPVFIPLFSSLLIPLIAIWLNKVEDGEFAVDAFELANVLIGGLFAVIALNFTVNGAYETVANGDNTATRLFGLNYLTLGLSLVVDIVLFRFNVAKRLFGRWVQEQTFLVLLWAIPVLSMGTGIAVVAAAACG